MGNSIDRSLIWCLLLCVISPQGLAAALELPDSARPGAVRPEDVGTAIVQESPPSEVMEVPPVIDRPFEIDEGPRVVVTEFRLVNAKDLPKFDIKLEEVQKHLQTFISQRPEGFTIGQLQELSDEVTRYYREKGLILAQAVLPVQTVEAGVVEIQVFEGKLGRILAEGNNLYSNRMLARPFKNLVGKPVTKEEIESALLTLTDYPGLSVFGVFQPGIQVGTADILLKVQEEKRFDVAYRADNHGLQETGRGRLRPTLEWNSLAGGADKLSITVQQTYRPKNNIFKAFDYEHYLGYGFRAGAFFNRNQFDVGGDLAAQEIFGETEQMGLFLDKSWIRSREMNLSSAFTLTRKESQTLVRGRLTNFDKLSVLSLTMNFDSVDTRFKGINFATVELSRGVNDLFGAMGTHINALELPAGQRPSRQGGPPDRKFAAGQFSKVFVTASRLQTIRPNLTFLLRAEYQWSNDLLVPMEQYSIGGPDNVRAFPQAQQLLDRALFGSAEFILNMPFITNKQAFGNRTWGELVQISAFYDHAVGRLNTPLTSEEQNYINFKGGGVQVRFTLPGTLEARIMTAWNFGGSKDLGSDEDNQPDNNRKPQIWGDITYRF